MQSKDRKLLAVVCSIVLVFALIVSVIVVYPTFAEESKNRMIYDFEGMTSIDTGKFVGVGTTFELNTSKYQSHDSINSLKATVTKTDTEWKIYPPAGESWNGKGLSFFYKNNKYKKSSGAGALSLYIAAVTKSGDVFKLGDANTSTAFNSTSYAEFSFLYDSLHKGDIVTGDKTGNIMKASDIADIDYLLFKADSAATKETLVYLDDFSVLPADAVVEDVYAAAKMGSTTYTGDHFTMTKNSDSVTLTLKDDSIYEENADLNDRIGISVNAQDVVDHRDGLYLVYDILVPRPTGLIFKVVNTDRSVEYDTPVKNWTNYENPGDFVTVKASMNSIDIGMSQLKKIGSFEFALNPDFMAPYNFLEVGESITIKNIRFTKGDPGTYAGTYSSLTPLDYEKDKLEYSDEELLAMDSVKVYDMNDFSGTVYSDIFDANNNPLYGTSVNMELNGLKKANDYYRYFGQYAEYKMLDASKFYAPDTNGNVRAQNFGMSTFNTSHAEARFNERYLDTATIDFWAACSKEMQVYVCWVDRTTWANAKCPVTIHKTEDGQFEHYTLKVRDIYDWTLNNLPGIMNNFNVRSMMELKFLGVNLSPEGYLDDGDYLRIAGVYCWTGEPQEINRLLDNAPQFHAENEDKTVMVDAYHNALDAKKTEARISDLKSDIEEYNPMFGSKAKIVDMHSVYFYSTEGGGRFTPGGKIWMQFKIPKGYDPQEVDLYAIYLDGEAELIRTAVEGDYLAAYTYEPGTYAIVAGEVGCE